MEETGKAGKKSNIEINADKGAKQNSHPGREEWPHLIRIGVMAVSYTHLDVYKRQNWDLLRARTWEMV